MEGFLHARAMDVEAARELARSLLADPLPTRWAHSQGVAGRARELAAVIGPDAELVEAAAWLHDIGYAPPLVETGFHPLDGARYLRDHGHGVRQLWTLVAHHTCAVIEAEERELLATLLDEFPVAEGGSSDLLNYLTYCDVTVDPTGTAITLERRLAEIQDRYPVDHVVPRAIARATPSLRATCLWVSVRIEELAK